MASENRQSASDLTAQPNQAQILLEKQDPEQAVLERLAFMKEQEEELAEHFSKYSRHYSFFQAVELIQRVFDDAREPGTGVMPGEDKIVFNVEHNMNFPTSDISSIELYQPINFNGSLLKPKYEKYKEEIDLTSRPFRLSVNFLGLHGSSSPLPSYYPEKVAQFEREGSLLRDFFDFYHNRVIGLLYRTMRKYRYYRQYQPKARDQFSHRVFSMFGLGNTELRENTQIHWARLLCFAGVLSARNRSPDLVAYIIQHAFFLKSVKVNEWIHRKVDIDPSQKWSLGRANSQLGLNSVIGDRVRDIKSKFQIEISELDFQRFQDFLPRGKDYKPLKNLVEFMLKDQFSYELKLGMVASEAKPLTLHTHEEGRLGWSSFMGVGDGGKKEVILTVRH